MGAGCNMEWITYHRYKLRAAKDFFDWLEENECGCGPGEFGNKLVPDKILGLSITEACCIHDHMYSIGQTEEEKTTADIELYANGMRIIKQKSNWLTLMPRAFILTIYMLACMYGGNSAFNGD
jgi:hypothetical protein